MSKKDIFEYFYTNSVNLSAKSILLILLAGLLISAIIFLTYRLTYNGVAYNVRFNASLVIVHLICIVIMLMISSNIVVSLGMVGALSIVRFRTAIKDSRDTVFMFWAIAEGLCVGSQNFKLSLITSLFIAAVIAAFTFLPKGKSKYLLIVRGGAEEISVSALLDAVKQEVGKAELKSVNKAADHQEMIFELVTKGTLDLSVIDHISAFAGVTSVNFVSESGENVG